MGAGSSWAAVEALAALLEPEAFDPDQPADETWRHVTQQRALSHAATVIMRGFRRVVEDDDTVERSAAAIADADAGSWADIQSGIRHGSKWAPKAAEYYRQLARAVVRALREDTSHD